MPTASRHFYLAAIPTKSRADVNAAALHDEVQQPGCPAPALRCNNINRQVADAT